MSASVVTRVIGAWGSDGFTDGSGNGFGPCGSYQYGSFNDFTLQVGLTTSTVDLGHRNNTITASPNPTSGLVVLSQARGLNAQDRFALQGIDGRMVRAWDTIGTGPLEIDLSDVPAGIYFVRNCTDANVRPLRIVKK